MLTYEPVCLTGREKYLRRWALCPMKTSDYSFGNIWGWAEEYGLEWGFSATHVWLRQTRPEIRHWAPVGPWNTPDWAQCPVLAGGMELTRVPEGLAELWKTAMPDRVRLTEAREHWDYVYSVPELTELRGNRFHKKKNLLSQFRRTYQHDFSDLTPDCVEATLDMQRQWYTWRDSEDSDTLLAENRAITRVLQNWDRLGGGLFGGVLRVEGEVAAYTVAEALAEDMLVIHFEKGRPGFKGVYQAVNQMFLAARGQDFAFVNREQDLGDEGLRKAKMSYNPVRFLKKFAVSVAPA
ncbi:MAG: phosphatidylglycerol lysyltransferase domain-containing protein [Desulfovibrionaceae bacterium]|nr:phosphatidylglycerol lysyltransferase domain-containing protein [Desulfovibrionaceae bacterium]